MGTLPRLMKRILVSSRNCAIGWKGQYEGLILENYPVLLFNGSNITSKSFSNDNGIGKGQLDEDGFDLSRLKEEERQRLEKIKQHLSKNNYYEMYKAKIVNAQRSSPEVFVVKAEKFGYKKPAVKKNIPKSDATDKSNESLRSILNVEVLETLGKDDIVFIWKAYNEKRGKIGDSVPGTVYERVASLASRYNMFIFPLPRNDGYEFFLSQFSNNVFHFTPLISYQTHKENSPVSLILANYTDLQFTKDLVLIMAEFNNKLMRPEDINNLYTQILLYYAYPDEIRMSSLKKFTETPSEFNHLDLISEYERLNKPIKYKSDNDKSDNPNLT